MAAPQIVDCSPLGTRTDFRSYIQLIINTTGGNFSLASDCKPEICGALWGSGNPDISGIGMTIGYVLEVVIGIILTSIFLVMSTWSIPKQRSSLGIILSRTFEAYFDGAMLLAFSVQLASVVMLVKVNFGLSANGMGANTIEITWIVSLLSLLPLSYGVYIFRNQDKAFMEAPKRDASTSRNDEKEKKEQAEAKADDGLRFLLFVLTWMISAYPFFSRMVCTFGPSQIGGGSGSVISTANWDQIQSTCYDGVMPLSDSTVLAMSIFGIAGWLFLALLVVGSIVSRIIEERHPTSRLAHRLNHENILSRQTWTRRPGSSWLLFAVVSVLEISQVWAYFVMQRQQLQMTQAEGISFVDQQWAFGQVIAVVVFVPVLVEMCNTIVRVRKKVGE